MSDKPSFITCNNLTLNNAGTVNVTEKIERPLSEAEQAAVAYKLRERQRECDVARKEGFPPDEMEAWEDHFKEADVAPVVARNAMTAACVQSLRDRRRSLKSVYDKLAEASRKAHEHVDHLRACIADATSKVTSSLALAQELSSKKLTELESMVSALKEGSRRAEALQRVIAMSEQHRTPQPMLTVAHSRRAEFHTHLNNTQREVSIVDCMETVEHVDIEVTEKLNLITVKAEAITLRDSISAQEIIARDRLAVCDGELRSLSVNGALDDLTDAELAGFHNKLTEVLALHEEWRENSRARDVLPELVLVRRTILSTLPDGPAAALFQLAEVDASASTCTEVLGSFSLLNMPAMLDILGFDGVLRVMEEYRTQPARAIATPKGVAEAAHTCLAFEPSVDPRRADQRRSRAIYALAKSIREYCTVTVLFTRQDSLMQGLQSGIRFVRAAPRCAVKELMDSTITLRNDLSRGMEEAHSIILSCLEDVALSAPRPDGQFDPYYIRMATASTPLHEEISARICDAVSQVNQIDRGTPVFNIYMDNLEDVCKGLLAARITGVRTAITNANLGRDTSILTLLAKLLASDEEQSRPEPDNSF
jgi:hypothetical protein